MIISLKKTMDIGDMGVIYLMNWTPNQKGEVYDPHKYFAIYYSKKFEKESKDFLKEIADNGIVMAGLNTHMILKNYINEQLEENQHLYTEPEDAVFDVFKRLYADKILIQDSMEGL